MHKLLEEDRRLKSQGNLPDGVAFDRLAHDLLAHREAMCAAEDLLARMDATVARSYRDLDAPGLVGRSLDVNG